MDIEFYEKEQKVRITTKKYISELNLPTPTNCIKGTISTNNENIIYLITANVQENFEQDFVYIFRTDLSNGKMIFIDEVIFLDRTTETHGSKIICCTKNKIFIDNKIIRFKKTLLANARISRNKKQDFWNIITELKSGFLINIILFKENLIFEQYDRNVQYSFQNLFFTDFSLIIKYKNKNIIKCWIETENIKELICLETKEENEFTEVLHEEIYKTKNKLHRINTFFMRNYKTNLLKAHVLKTDDEKTVKIMEEEFNVKPIANSSEIEKRINTFIINNWKKPKNEYGKNLMIFNLTGKEVI